MGKIICEVCGTVYPDSADCCPICGYSRDRGGFDQGEDLLNQQDSASQYEGADFDLSQYDEFAGYEEKSDEHQDPQYQQPQQGRRQIFDYDAVNPGDRRRSSYDSYEDVGNEVTLNDYPQDSYDNYDNYNQRPPKSHTGLIIFLVILIIALIGASGFLLVKFILPNLNPEQPTVVTQPLMTEAPTTMPTTEPTIPCESLALVEGGEVKLSREGQFYLIHATVSPEDTTDQLSYRSENEEIILVDEDGKITAVGEGKTNVILTCGSQIIRLPVSVHYQEEEETTEAAAETVGETADETADGTEAAGETAAAEETKAAEGTEAADGTEGTEETVPETTDDGLKDVELKLKGILDRASGVQGVSFRLELDCDLSPEEVEWSSTDMRVATVKNGVVTTVGHGVCQIVAKYGAQEVRCIIRCTF